MLTSYQWTDVLAIGTMLLVVLTECARLYRDRQINWWNLGMGVAVAFVWGFSHG